MPDPTVPAVLADVIKELKRRVRALENAQRLVASAIQGGRMRVLQSDETPVIAIGQLDSGLLGTEIFDDSGDVIARFGQVDSGVRDGLEMFAAGTRIFRADDRGMISPGVHIPMAPTVTTYSVSVPNTGAGYTVCYQGRIIRPRHKYMKLVVSATGGVGTGGFIRARTSTGQTSAALTVPSGGGITASLYWELTYTTGTPEVVLWLECRNPSGPNNIEVGWPDVNFEDHTATATTGGVWI